MRKYRSHKIVEAGKITRLVHNPDYADWTVAVDVGGGVNENTVVIEKVFARGVPAIGDYLVRYDDGYLSWSPAKPFEEGYTLMEDAA